MNHHRGLRLTVALLISLSLVGCGSGDDEAVATRASVETGRPTRDIPDTSIPPPGERNLDNKNVRDGGLGNVCWAAYELGLAVIDAVNAGEHDPAEAEAALVRLRKTAGTDARDALDDAIVPAGARSFVDQLIDNVETIADMSDKELTLDRVSSLLTYDSYPGLDGLEDAVRGHASCPRFQG